MTTASSRLSSSLPADVRERNLHQPLHPTTRGMVVVDEHEALFCSQFPNQISVRSAIPSTKFVVKGGVHVPLTSSDAVFRCIHYPRCGDWIWAAASTGEVVAVHLVTHKYVVVNDAASMGDGAPVAALDHIVTSGSASSASPSQQRSSTSSSTVFVVGVSRVGTVTLWDAKSRVVQHVLRLSGLLAKSVPTASSGQRTPANYRITTTTTTTTGATIGFGESDENAAALSPLELLVSHDTEEREIAARIAPLPTTAAQELPIRAHRFTATENASSCIVRCMAAWSRASVVFLGLASGALVALDLRRPSAPTLQQFPSSIAEGCAIACDVEEYRHLDARHTHHSSAPQSTDWNRAPASDVVGLWYGTSHGAVGKLVLHLTSGASEGGSLRVLGSASADVVENRKYCHKVLVAKAGEYVVATGGDGRVAILDSDTLNVIQRLILDDGVIAQEMVCLGERTAGSVSVLLAMSDRTLRCLSLKTRPRGVSLVSNSSGGVAHAAPGSRHSTPTGDRRPLHHHHHQIIGHSKEGHPYGSPMRSVLATAHVDAVADAARRSSPSRRLPLMPSVGVHSTQQLIHHCLALLREVQALSEREERSRDELVADEAVARGRWTEYWTFLCGGRLGTLRGKLLHVQFEEAAIRLHSLEQWALHQQQSTLEHIAAGVQLWRCHAWNQEVQALLREEASARQSIDFAATGDTWWAELRTHSAHDWEFRGTIASVWQQLIESESALSRLESMAAAMPELVPIASRVPDLEAQMARLTSAHDALVATNEKLGRDGHEARREAEALRAALASCEGQRRVEQQVAFLESCFAVRRGVAMEEQKTFVSLVLSARGAESRYLATCLRDLRDARSAEAGYRRQCASLEQLSVKLRVELRELEVEADSLRSVARRGADDETELRDALQQARQRLAVADERNNTLEVQHAKALAKQEQLEVRLHEAAKLNEDTFATALAQQERIRRLLTIVDATKNTTVELLKLGEVDFDSGLVDPSLREARSCLRDVLTTLAAAKRHSGKETLQLEADMTESAAAWLRHERAGEEMVSAVPRRDAAGSGDGLVGRSSDGTHLTPGCGPHVTRAFELTAKALECIGPRWGDEVIVLRKVHYVQAVRALLRSIEQSEKRMSPLREDER